MNVATISDLYRKQAEIWKYENEHYFGITPLDQWTNEDVIQNHLNKCAEQFWNKGTNEMKELLENGKCNDMDKFVPGSYKLIFDTKTSVICLYGDFKQQKHDITTGDLVENIKTAPLVYMPYANDLCWFLNETEYVLRISANVNFDLINRQGNMIRYKYLWSYNLDTDEFKIRNEETDPFESLNYQSKLFLKTWYGQEITPENFKDAMKSLPEKDRNSILYFQFSYVDGMFDLVRYSKRFANPLLKVAIPINVVKMFTAQKTRTENLNDGSFTNLVLSSNKLFALENSRTVIYKSQYNSSFSFNDATKFFDAFKTSTSKSAGRSRLILDNTFIQDGILWHEIDGENYDMFQLVKNDHLEVRKNLSVLSCSNFSSNNDAKRIMMTAKLRAQAIPTVGEADSFTHETPARIVFGDFKGFNYGDSIIISRSFARKLQSRYIRKVAIYNYEQYNEIVDKYKVGDYMTSDDFIAITRSTMCANYRNIKIESLNMNFLTVSADAPFGVGDKITNLHGSKGIVSLILDDDEMPYLKNDIGNFKAGPFDVIVSGLSVYRRKSLGQIFEAWALATGHTDVNNIQDAVKYYSDSMKDFASKSVVCWHGKETIKPCGINMIIRLDHNATGKQSHSYIKTNYARMLKFGEMELLNLAARGLTDIINEIDIRSISKHRDAFYKIRDMQKTGKLDHEIANNMRFFNILRTIGFDFQMDANNSQNKADANESQFLDLKSSVIDDNRLDLFEGDETDESED